MSSNPWCWYADIVVFDSFCILFGKLFNSLKNCPRACNFVQWAQPAKGIVNDLACLNLSMLHFFSSTFTFAICLPIIGLNFVAAICSDTLAIYPSLVALDSSFLVLARMKPSYTFFSSRENMSFAISWYWNHTFLWPIYDKLLLWCSSLFYGDSKSLVTVTLC